MGIQAPILGVLVVAVAVLAFLAFSPAEEREAGAAAAREVALTWTDAELADRPRRVGDGWEVDVRRADGSLVEVSLNGALRLQGLDEELDSGGRRAHDEVVGAGREKAIAAARPRSDGGRVRSVEREVDGTIEVDFVTPGRRVIEVELDSRFRVKDVDEEEIGDE